MSVQSKHIIVQDFAHDCHVLDHADQFMIILYTHPKRCEVAVEVMRTWLLVQDHAHFDTAPSGNMLNANCTATRDRSTREAHVLQTYPSEQSEQAVVVQLNAEALCHHTEVFCSNLHKQCRLSAQLCWICCEAPCQIG